MRHDFRKVMPRNKKNERNRAFGVLCWILETIAARINKQRHDAKEQQNSTTIYDTTEDNRGVRNGRRLNLRRRCHQKYAVSLAGRGVEFKATAETSSRSCPRTDKGEGFLCLCKLFPVLLWRTSAPLSPAALIPLASFQSSDSIHSMEVIFHYIPIYLRSIYIDCQDLRVL